MLVTLRRFFNRHLLIIFSILLAGILFGGLLSPSAYALRFGYAPEQYENRLTYGIGVYFAPNDTLIYATPDENTEPVEHFQWSPNGRHNSLFSQVRQSHVPVSSIFVCYFPKMDVAAMSVVSDNGEGWAEVVYDQRRGKTGWVKLRTAMAEDEIQGWPMHLGQFQTWLDFMKFNGKAAGIYWLTGVSEYHRSPRMSPDNKAKLLNLQMIRKLKVMHVRGNWLLVEVMDFDRSMPMGWIRWRDKEGRLMVFPNLAGKKTPHVLGVF